MTNRFIARQGDVLIFETDNIPDGLKEVPPENGRVVLAHGEVTGHTHAIDSPDVMFLESDIGEMADRFLLVERECQVLHDEHETVVLPPRDTGGYTVRRQREYQPEAPRQVAD